MGSPRIHNSAEAIAVSKALVPIADQISEALAEATGRDDVAFSLFVWTDGRANYISNSDDRATIKQVLLGIISGWDAGMPDIPAHEVQG